MPRLILQQKMDKHYLNGAIKSGLLESRADTQENEKNRKEKHQFLKQSDLPTLNQTIVLPADVDIKHLSNIHGW